MKAQSSSSSKARYKYLWRGSFKAKIRRVKYVVDKIDRISELPDDILQKILSRLSTENAVKTSVLSKRWVDLWKWRPHFCVDMTKIMKTVPTKRVHEVSLRFAKSMTKTLNNHIGYLESCTIGHYVSQCEDGTLAKWIQTVTHMKHTKELTLVNYIGCMGPYDGYNTLNLPTSIFSHYSLTSLSLTRYKLTETNAFKSCCNLKILKLHDIIADVNVLSRAFAACSSLEVLVLHITALNRRGRLTIKNKNLKVLQVSCSTLINNMEVIAARLEILDIRYIYCERHNFILDAPKLRFNRNYWVAAGTSSHISYNITCLAQEKKSIWLEVIASQFYEMRRTGSLSVSVDMTNPSEVEILKEVLLLWGDEMKELEIILKDNNGPSKEGEGCMNDEADEMWWDDDEKPFPDAYFRVYTVWMYNFNGSNEEEFALASRFVRQGTVIDKLMIQTSAYPPTKKLMTEAKVTKLMQLIPKGNDGLTIECF